MARKTKAQLHQDVDAIIKSGSANSRITAVQLNTLLDDLVDSMVEESVSTATVFDASYTHVQQIPNSVWQISHGLGKYPSVVIVDSAGTQVIGEVVYLSLNWLEVSFSAPFAGTVHCN